MEAETRQRKRRVVMVALAACLVVAGIGGTLAWFSAQSQLTNTFKVGSITPPTTEPGDPDVEIPKGDPNLSGNLYEPSWKNESKIGPGAYVPKDPYVGIGKDSEPAYVYIYVKNKFTSSEKPYFQMQSGWEAVQATQATAGAGYYTEGLFVYGAANNPTKLDPGKAPDSKDAWTKTPLFTHVLTSDGFTSVAGGIEVYAYVAATSSEKDTIDDLDAAAKAWVGKIEATA